MNKKSINLILASILVTNPLAAFAETGGVNKIVKKNATGAVRSTGLTVIEEEQVRARWRQEQEEILEDLRKEEERLAKDRQRDAEKKRSAAEREHQRLVRETQREAERIKKKEEDAKKDAAKKLKREQERLARALKKAEEDRQDELEKAEKDKQRAIEKAARDQARAERQKARELEKARKAAEDAERDRLKAEKKAREKLEKEQTKAQAKPRFKHRYRANSTTETENHVEVQQDYQSIKLQSESIDENPSFVMKREELQAEEREVVDFIFPSVEQAEEEILETEEFFTNSEKDQLLELWRATIARNRTIQFIIKVLSPDNDTFKKNNGVVQALSKAVFVPFYAAAAVADNALITSGASAGARVLGDVVDNVNQRRSQTKSVTQTEMVVMFMLVDEVAQRLRDAYKEYRLIKIEKDLLQHDLKAAQIDAGEAIDLNGEGSQSAIFMTRSAVRGIENSLRRLDLAYRSARGVLVELAGKHSVNNVDVLIDLEVETLISDVTKI